MIKISRRLYQQFHEIVAQIIWNQNERRRNKFTSRSSTSTSIETIRSITSIVSKNLIEVQRKVVIKFKEYLFIVKRLNLHIELNYELVMKKYAMFNNCNVLIEENKHRKFKNEIYNINYFNVKKALLSRENMR